MNVGDPVTVTMSTSVDDHREDDGTLVDFSTGHATIETDRTDGPLLHVLGSGRVDLESSKVDIVVEGFGSDGEVHPR